uniref:Putative secreted protein n=1 Tax=Anopheles darlingi TaxID=43151 RepID=A0A2M4DIV5_ANODA
MGFIILHAVALGVSSASTPPTTTDSGPAKEAARRDLFAPLKQKEFFDVFVSDTFRDRERIVLVVEEEKRKEEELARPVF